MLTFEKTVLDEPEGHPGILVKAQVLNSAFLSFFILNEHFT